MRSGAHDSPPALQESRSSQFRTRKIWYLDSDGGHVQGGGLQTTAFWWTAGIAAAITIDRALDACGREEVLPAEYT